MSLTNLTEHAHRVLAFMLRAKQDCPTRPTVPDDRVRILRAKLVFEEAMELINEGLGVDVIETVDEKGEKSHKFVIARPADIVQVADGYADLSVVNTGTAIAFGLEDKAILEIVDRNNLAKFGPGHSFREDGKLIKPPDHRKPDLATEIHLQTINAKGA